MALTFLSLLIAASAPALAIPTSRAIEVRDAQWEPQGCYADSVSRRALAQDAFYDNKGMTVEICLNYCTAGGYPFAGLEYSRECYCGLVNRSAGKVDATDCNQICSGSNQEICGGANGLSLYARLIPEPSANPGANGYRSLGCWADNITTRVLSRVETVPGGASNMSVAACTAACASQGHVLAALEYGGECWCDDHYQVEPTVSTNCDMPCRGNMSELCGGELAFQLYSLAATTPAVSTTIIPETTALPVSSTDSPQAQVPTPATSDLVATIVAPGTTRRLLGLQPPATVVSSSTSTSTATSSNITATPALSAVPVLTDATPLAAPSAEPVLTLLPSILTQVTSTLPNPTSSPSTSPSLLPFLPLSLTTSTSTSPTNLIQNPTFATGTPPWRTVTNPSHADYSNLLGSPSTSNTTTAYIMSTKPVRTSTTRSFCLSQPLTVATQGTYRFSIAIGRQILNATGKPVPSTDRLRFELYYDSALMGGAMEVCNAELGGCEVQGEFGAYEEVTGLVRVPYGEVGEHTVAVCGVFEGDATFGLDAIVVYEVGFSGPTKGGR